VDVILL